MSTALRLLIGLCTIAELLGEIVAGVIQHADHLIQIGELLFIPRNRVINTFAGGIVLIG